MRPAGLHRIAAALDPRGRLSAAAYRRTILRTLPIAAGVACLSIWLATLGERTLAILAFLGGVGVGLTLLSATIRRLHDRDRSSWWLAAYGLVYGASLAPLQEAVDRYPVAVLATVLGMLGFTAWFFVEIGLLAGTPGPNRFGPPTAGGPDTKNPAR